MTFWQISAFNKVNINKAPNTKKTRNIEFCSEDQITKLNNVQGSAQQMLFCFSWTFIVTSFWVYTIMSLSEKAKTRLAPSANYFLKNPFAHHQTHDGSQDDSSFTFLDLSRLQSSPTTSLAAPSQWATKLILNCAGF